MQEKLEMVTLDGKEISYRELYWRATGELIPAPEYESDRNPASNEILSRQIKEKKMDVKFVEITEDSNFWIEIEERVEQELIEIEEREQLNVYWALMRLSYMTWACQELLFAYHINSIEQWHPTNNPEPKETAIVEHLLEIQEETLKFLTIERERMKETWMKIGYITEDMEKTDLEKYQALMNNMSGCLRELAIHAIIESE